MGLVYFSGLALRTLGLDQGMPHQRRVVRLEGIVEGEVQEHLDWR